MNTLNAAELNELLPVVMNLRSLRGLSLADALEVAKARYEELHAIYKLNALDRRNEVEFCNARAAVLRVALIIEVLEAGIVQEAAQAVKAPRYPFYREIRRAYAIAREAGLDTKADEAMRAAFASILGRKVPSRETMNGRDWLLVGNAIKERRLTW